MFSFMFMFLLIVWFLLLQLLSLLALLIVTFAFLDHCRFNQFLLWSLVFLLSYYIINMNYIHSVIDSRRRILYLKIYRSLVV
jgi:hypothetical protein